MHGETVKSIRTQFAPSHHTNTNRKVTKQQRTFCFKPDESKTGSLMKLLKHLLTNF